MSDYRAPLREMQFLLYEVMAVEDLWLELPDLSDSFDRATADVILAEGAKLAVEVIAPHNRQSDEQGAHWKDGEVSTPDGFVEAYRRYCEGHWGGLCGEKAYGGMGSPKILGALFEEMIQSASISFALYPMLTAGACLAINAHADEAIKQIYLEKLYSGTWSGTMCLTEAHSGSDLGIMRTKAVPAENNVFNITGTKIFITGGEHDLTENIVHLVLAKLPDAPSGPRGISMFLVPKFLVNEDGSLGTRNTVSCGSIEHKMGIKGSATCVMNFDSAVGYLIGAPGKGLNYMFTMMNYERLGMGIQGLAAAEASYQRAALYARDRLQGRSPLGPQAPDKLADPIIVHPDVRRMLLTMRVCNEAGRCFSTYVAKQLDLAKFSPDEKARERADQLVALLTPVAKAFMTDMAFESCVMGQQVLGGHGYIREWGQEQLVRDVRIAQIYEGTNGIQALDLLGRKVVANDGAWLDIFVGEIEEFIRGQSENTSIAEYVEPLGNAVETLRRATAWVVERSATDAQAVGAAAADYMAVFGYVSYAYMWCLMVARCPDNAEDAFYANKRILARYYLTHILPRIHSHYHILSAGSESLMALPDERF